MRQPGFCVCDQCFEEITTGGRMIDGEDWCDDCFADRSVLPQNQTYTFPFEGTPVFVEDPVLGILVKAGITVYDTHDPRIKAVPAWAAQAASAVLSVVWFVNTDQALEALRKVARLPELQSALVTGRAVGASGMDLYWMIEEWEQKRGGFA